MSLITYQLKLQPGWPMRWDSDPVANTLQPIRVEFPLDEPIRDQSEWKCLWIDQSGATETQFWKYFNQWEDIPSINSQLVFCLYEQ